jgi:hypothetical protein
MMAAIYSWRKINLLMRRLGRQVQRIDHPLISRMPMKLLNPIWVFYASFLLFRNVGFNDFIFGKAPGKIHLLKKKDVL